MKPFLTSPLWDAGTPEFWRNWQFRRLRDYLKNRVLPFSPHYKALFAENGIEIGDLRGWDDWAKVPFTSKADLTSTPGGIRDFLLMPEEKVLKREPRNIIGAVLHGPRHVREKLAAEFRPLLLTSTTGRSGTPVPFLYSQHDLDNLATAGRRIMEVARALPEYRHVNVFPYAPHLAFWQSHYASLGFGTFMVSTGGGKCVGTDGNINFIEKIKPDVLIGMPTFIYHLLRQAVEEGRRWTTLRRIVLGGEKASDGLRAKLRELASQLGSLGVYVVSIYGFTEAKMAFPECPTMPMEGPGGFHLFPDLGMVEVIDPKTGLAVPEGARGEIVYTPLDSRGTVVMRYRTGDIAEGGLSWARCPHCGRRLPRLIGPISRVSEMRSLSLDKVKGTLVDFNVLEHLLDDQRGIAGWQIELRKRNDDPMECDEVVLHTAADTGVSEITLREQILRRFHEVTELQPNQIAFHSVAELRELLGVGRLLKEEKIADHRPRSDSRPSSSQPSTSA